MTQSPRRPIIHAALLVACGLFSQQGEAGDLLETRNKLIWHDVADWELEGQGWPASELKSRYDRLPAKAESIVRERVWSLSRTSAGLSVKFNTDATEISFRYKLGSKSLALPHMPATGASGIDLYALDEGHWKWVTASKPTSPEVTHKIDGIDPGLRTYLLYLPLRNSVEKLEIGVPSRAVISPVAPRGEAPIVFYGTSITHGACASRPGMTHVAMLGRRLDIPVINLGFAGNGTMDSEMGALLTELDASVYVIDCLPNMDAESVAQRTEPLVKQLREARPNTPIVLVEDRSFTNSWIFASRRDHHRESRAALTRAYDNLVSSGIVELLYLSGDALLGSDTEAATDGSHPSDLGFVRQADVFEPILKKALR